MQQHQGEPAGAQPLAGEDWRSRAACRFTEPDLFFPISDCGHGLEQAAAAKAVCADCAVQRECLAFAVGARERHGIWGGMTAQERHWARKDQLKWPTAPGGAPCAPVSETPDRGRVQLNQGRKARAAAFEGTSRAGALITVGDPRSGRELVDVHATAARIACEQMTEPALNAMRDSVLRAVSRPAGLGWKRKATAHAEILRLLADAGGMPSALTGATGLVLDLMLTVGPGADALISNSRRRLLACLCARDADGAATEMEAHLRALQFMERLVARSAVPPQSPGTPRKGA